MKAVNFCLNLLQGTCRIAFCVLIFSACMVGPKYQAPEIEVPCEWHGTIPSNANCASPEEVVWWKHLQDPLLNELIERAADQNLDLQIAAIRVIQARAEANAKKADLYPRIDGTANYGHVYCSKEALNGITKTLGTKSCNPRRNVNFYEVGFDVEWELDFFGLSKHEIAAMKAHEEAVEELLCSVWVTLSAEIAKNYIELRGFQKRLERIGENGQVQAEAIRLSEELLKRGLVNESDYSRLKADRSTLLAEATLVEFNCARCMHRIAILLGYNPGELFECLSPHRPLPQLPCELSIGIPSELLRRRPDIRKAERDLAFATERVGSAIANLFPRFSLRGFIGEISTNVGSLFNPSSFAWFAGPQILVPIFNSRLLLQDVEYNKMATQEALITYQKTVLEALEEAENVIAAFKYEEERFGHLSEAYEFSQKALTFTQELYEKGLNDLFAVTDARKLLLAAEESRMQSQVDLLLNYVSLYKALGGSWGRE